MRTWITLSVLSAVLWPLTGCGLAPARDFVETLPSAAFLLVDFPGAEETSAARMSSAGAELEQAFRALPTLDGTEVDSAACYDGTLELATRANATVAYVLNGLDTVTDYRPQQVEDGIYQWGPWESQDGTLDLRLRMSMGEEGDYVYSFQGSSGLDEDYLQLIFGLIEGDSTREAGIGSFVLDYDNLEALQPSGERNGQASFGYQYDGTGAREIIVQLTDFMFESGEISDAVLEFERNADTTGVLDWFRMRDGYDDGMGEALQESYAYRSRWLADHSGRCDGIINGGDLGAHEVKSHQCWDSTTAEVYFVSELDGEEVKNRGALESCAFADAVYAD